MQNFITKEILNATEDLILTIDYHASRFPFNSPLMVNAVLRDLQEIYILNFGFKHTGGRLENSDLRLVYEFSIDSCFNGDRQVPAICVQQSVA